MPEFDGKIYRLEQRFIKKWRAKAFADRVRRYGGKARVLKRNYEQYKYAVYVRWARN